MAKTRRFVQWFGANTEHAEEPGKLLEGCRFVGIPFAGGMSEVPFITAKQILVNDLHKHIINLCRVVKDDHMRKELIRQCDALPYHPDVLETYKRYAKTDFLSCNPYMTAAVSYFVCVWMGRGGKAGTKDELKGGLPIRWNADGGGSNRRYRTAIEALDEWGKAFKRCEFVCMDALDFLIRFQDREGHGLFVDAPWPEVGDGYRHTLDESGQRDLAALLLDCKHARIVVRYGEHPLIRKLYPESAWKWIPLESRTQANERKPEFLICRNLPKGEPNDT
jgi:DNA adenine methylase